MKPTYTRQCVVLHGCASFTLIWLFYVQKENFLPFAKLAQGMSALW